MSNCNGLDRGSNFASTGNRADFQLVFNRVIDV
jgi:hypothetical protein